jgi:ferredoxin
VNFVRNMVRGRIGAQFYSFALSKVYIDPTRCFGCGGSRVILNVDRCIGCGLCVTTCPSGALTLVRKPDSYLTLVPESLDKTWRIISLAQADMRS